MGGALPGVVSGALGLGGLLSNILGQKSANSYQSAAAGVLNNQNTAQQAILGQGLGYDPAAQDAQAAEVAGNTAGMQLGNAAKGINAAALGAGGSPTGDTLYQANLGNAASGILAPLALQQAQNIATEPERKIGAISTVLNAPAGSLANGYMNLAQSKAPGGTSWQSALNYLGQGFGSLLNPASGSGVPDPSVSQQGNPAGYQGPMNWAGINLTGAI